MSENRISPLTVKGWTIFAHPLFLEQLEALTRQVEKLKRKDPAGYTRKNAAKRLAAIAKLIFEVIPEDPARPEYRQGKTLGEDHKHWFRAKFFQQYRLFFRYHAASKVIVYAWVNDEDTKRAYESRDDAYRIFRKMLESGHPPDDWDRLLSVAREESGRPSSNSIVQPTPGLLLRPVSCASRSSRDSVSGFRRIVVGMAGVASYFFLNRIIAFR